MTFTEMNLDDVLNPKAPWATDEYKPRYLFGGHRVGDEWEGLLGCPQGVLAKFPGLAVRVINRDYSRRQVPPRPLFGTDLAEWNRMVELLHQSPEFNEGEYGWRYFDILIPEEVRRVRAPTAARFWFTVSPRITYAMAQHLREEMLLQAVDVKLHFPLHIREGKQVH